MPTCTGLACGGRGTASSEGGMCITCFNRWMEAAGRTPISQQELDARANSNRLEQLKKENEDLKKKVEEHEKCWWDKQLLQAGRTNAEKARDDAKSNLTKEQTAHQQTKKDKAAVEQELAKLKKEHATCTTTIQALEKEKEALQKKVNELNEVITGVPQPQVDTEARVQQTSLLPK